MNHNLCIIGTGYVGLVTAAYFADLGHKVIGIDNNIEKINKLKKGIIPIYEPGLEAIVKTNQTEKRLEFSTDISYGVKNSDIIFICVGTPPKENGEPDLSSVEFVAKEIAKAANGYKLIVEKSTVPVKTADWLKSIMKEYIKKDFDIASNPEFLKEGTAVSDFKNPDRVVIGADSMKADSILTDLYKNFKAPFCHTSIAGAEIIKHTSNAFLSMKISFANMIAQLCEKSNADVEEVMAAVGLDKRIGKDFLKAGLGYGGFCFPKDLDAFISILEKQGINANLLKEVKNINNAQREYFVGLIEKELSPLENKTLGALGLSFKPGTDDIRYSPAIDVIKKLLEKGTEKIKVYDPKAMERVKEEKILDTKRIVFCDNPLNVTILSDALLILTEWPEFKDLSLLEIKQRLTTPYIFDGRNIYDPNKARNLGFNYFGIGR